MNPLHNSNTRSRRPTLARGFTAIEMMVVIAICGVLASIAMPSFADFSVNQRLRTATYDLMADLIYARGEAIKRNNRVIVTRVGTNWASGWTITDVNGVALRQHPALDTSVTESTGPGNVTFGLDGHQVGSGTATFTFDDLQAKATIPVRKVVLDASGRPRSS